MQPHLHELFVQLVHTVVLLDQLHEQAEQRELMQAAQALLHELIAQLELIVAQQGHHHVRVEQQGLSAARQDQPLEQIVL